MAEAAGEAGEDSAAVMMPSQQRAEEGTSFGLKCIKDKKVPIGVTVVVAALLLTVIALAARKCPSCPSCPSPILPSCLENGIGYRGKCFYFVEDEADWNGSQSSCLSLRARLATIDTWDELRFLLRYGSSLHHWVGLRREGSGPWKWVNGSLFNNLFDIQGEGQCAYINADGISSDWCSQMKYSICSHPQKRPSRIQKDAETLLNSTKRPLGTGDQPQAATNPTQHGSEPPRASFQLWELQGDLEIPKRFGKLPALPAAEARSCRFWRLWVDLEELDGEGQERSSEAESPRPGQRSGEDPSVGKEPPNRCAGQPGCRDLTRVALVSSAPAGIAPAGICSRLRRDFGSGQVCGEHRAGK
ncbi:LOW QUALITY PROTEIN: uncharacterized protein RG961_014777 [Leptosomus discolor]